MAQQTAYITCPHIVEGKENKDGTRDESKPCGLDPRGKGRRTQISIPFTFFDGDDFVVECPACHNDVVVKSRNLIEETEEVST